MKNSDFDKVIKNNDIIQGAMKQEPIDMELWSWLGGDILKLSYIKNDLEKGKQIEDVARFYGVTVDGIKKYVSQKH